MANIKSKIKRTKQARVDELANKQTKSLIKTELRKFREAVDANDMATAQDVGKKTVRILDKAASKGVIHDNRSAARKSYILSTLNKKGAAAKAKPQAKAKAKPQAKAAKAPAKKTKQAAKKAPAKPKKAKS